MGELHDGKKTKTPGQAEGQDDLVNVIKAGRRIRHSLVKV